MVAGNFLLAVAVVLDKFIISGPIADPRRYAMLSALASIFSLFLLVPGLAGIGGEAFLFHTPNVRVILLALAQGIVIISALFFLFTAFKRGEASRVAPAVGALNAIFTILLAVLFLGERLALLQAGGIVLLIAGSLFLTFRAATLRAIHSYAAPAMISGFLFALSFVLLKALFGETSFVSAIVTVGIAQFLVGLVMLISALRGEYVGERSSAAARAKSQLVMPKPVFVLFVGKQISASVGTLAISFAISLTSVSVVNATEGVKYAFLFVMMILLSLYFPRILGEDLRGSSVVAKVLGVIFVGIGLSFVAFGS